MKGYKLLLCCYFAVIDDKAKEPQIIISLRQDVARNHTEVISPMALIQYHPATLIGCLCCCRHDFFPLSSASRAAEASKQVEHKWHSMCTSESWRTLVFLKAVIHFVGNDDDSGERERVEEGRERRRDGISWVKGPSSGQKWNCILSHRNEALPWAGVFTPEQALWRRLRVSVSARGEAWVSLHNGREKERYRRNISLTWMDVLTGLISPDKVKSYPTDPRDWKAAGGCKQHRRRLVSPGYHLQAPRRLCCPANCNATLHSWETE